MNARHGHTGGAYKSGQSPTYMAWAAMKQAALNPKSKTYLGDGNPGVYVGWMSFGPFLAAMGPRPAGTVLRRRDTALGFTPDNCFWEPKSASRAASIEPTAANEVSGGSQPTDSDSPLRGGGTGGGVGHHGPPLEGNGRG